jgi:hypothetical protein
MNKIELEGKTYEVLAIDRISKITHAKYAGMGDDNAPHQAKYQAFGGSWGIMVKEDDVQEAHFYPLSVVKKHNIQPMRLVPKEPVTFEATFARESTGYWYPLHHLDDGIAYEGKVQRKFRCVEIVEEEAHAILKAKGVDV